MSGKLQGQVLEIFLLLVILCCILIGASRGLLLSLYHVVKNLLIIAATIGIAPVIVKRLPDTLTAREGIGYIIAFFWPLSYLISLAICCRLLVTHPFLEG